MLERLGDPDPFSLFLFQKTFLSPSWRDESKPDLLLRLVDSLDREGCEYTAAKVEESLGQTYRDVSHQQDVFLLFPSSPLLRQHNTNALRNRNGPALSITLTLTFPLMPLASTATTTTAELIRTLLDSFGTIEGSDVVLELQESVEWVWKGKSVFLDAFVGDWAPWGFPPPFSLSSANEPPSLPPGYRLPLPRHIRSSTQSSAPLGSSPYTLVRSFSGIFSVSNLVVDSIEMPWQLGFRSCLPIRFCDSSHIERSDLGLLVDFLPLCQVSAAPLVPVLELLTCFYASYVAILH
ncbi:hypothetical protein NMY22_g5960 [Coprinellus aureogranulatus]|nr:hypothetical protein NMY22_g5960 [Coprinellus aureogranulatus]